MGGRNQVRGRERMWDWFVCEVGVGRKFCRNLWVSLLLLHLKSRRLSLWLLIYGLSFPGWEMGTSGLSHLLACWN